MSTEANDDAGDYGYTPPDTGMDSVLEKFLAENKIDLNAATAKQPRKDRTP